MASLRCNECGVERNEHMPWFRLYVPDTDMQHCLCSIECVLAKAWDIKESRPKLSKSKGPI